MKKILNTIAVLLLVIFAMGSVGTLGYLTDGYQNWDMDTIKEKFKISDGDNAFKNVNVIFSLQEIAILNNCCNGIAF